MKCLKMKIDGKKIAIGFILLVVIVEIIQVLIIIYIKNQPKKHLQIFDLKYQVESCHLQVLNEEI